MYEKVFILEASGLTVDLVRQHLEHLPRFRKFLDEGAWSDIVGPPPPTTPTSFGCVSTGKNPGKTGLFDYFLFPEGSYEQVPYSSALPGASTFYRELCDGGRRIGLLDVPLTSPLPELEGFVVSADEGCGENYATPPDVLEDLERLGYVAPFGASYSAGREVAFLKHCLAVVQTRRSALRCLFGSRSWEFGMLSTVALGEILHAFWRYSDSRHPAYMRPEEVFEGLDPVRECLKAIDGLLGDAIELAGSGGLVIALGAWGHQLEHSRVLVNALLAAEGYLHFKRGPGTRIKRGLDRLGVTAGAAERIAHRLDLYRLFHYKLQQGTRSAVKGQIFLSFGDIDWERTRAVAVGSQGQIHINLRGRQPQGAVASEDYERDRTALKSLIEGLRDPGTGDAVVESVRLREEVYAGPYATRGPDLLLSFREGYSGDGAISSGGSVVTRSPPNHSSDHAATGALFALGEGVRRGNIESRLVDVAPTVLRALNVEVPGDYDGRVLPMFG